MKKTFTTTIERDGSMCFVPIPFDPRSIFGKVRVPVKVTLNGYTYRSTIASMGHGPCLPLRRSHREAAGLEGNETLRVTLERDASVRSLAAPRAKGETARGDYVAGARRTLAVAPEVLWAFVVSAAGQKWLGGKAALKSKTSDVTTFVAGSHYRRRVPEGLLQVRVLVAPRDRSTLALHMENLAGADVRAEALARLRRALDGIERAVSDAPPPGEKAKKSRR